MDHNLLPLASVGITTDDRSTVVVGAVATLGGSPQTAAALVADLEPALERALHAVRQEGRQALLNIECQTVG